MSNISKKNRVVGADFNHGDVERQVETQVSWCVWKETSGLWGEIVTGCHRRHGHGYQDSIKFCQYCGDRVKFLPG